MDIIFMGTPDFAVPVLETLTASEKHTVKPLLRSRIRREDAAENSFLHQSKKWR